MPATAVPPASPLRSVLSEDQAERLDEVAAILALGVLRLHARENTRDSKDFGEFPLDFAGRASVHGKRKNNGRKCP